MKIFLPLYTLMATLVMVSSAATGLLNSAVENRYHQILSQLGPWEATSDASKSSSTTTTSIHETSRTLQGGDGSSSSSSSFTLLELTGQLQGSFMQYRVNFNDPRVGGQDTITIAYRTPALGWLAIGFSDSTGLMVGSEAVIGVPATGQVLKYSLTGKSVDGVVPLPDDQQTLLDQAVVQDTARSTTTLIFTKIMTESNEKEIVGGVNTLLGAYSTSNTLGIHTNRQAFEIDLSSVIVDDDTNGDNQGDGTGQDEWGNGSSGSGNGYENGGSQGDGTGQDGWGTDTDDSGSGSDNGWDNEETGSPTVVGTTPPAAAPITPPVAAPTSPTAAAPTTPPVTANQNGLTQVALDGSLQGSTLQFKVNPSDPNAGGDATVTFEYTVPQLGWVAIGFSDNGGFMVGSEAVIGLPDTGEVLKYELNGKVNSAVTPMATAKQTLLGTAITQDGSSTTLTFTKRMVEDGEVPIVLGSNTFLGAYGGSNTLGIHTNRDSFQLDLASVEGVASSVQTRKQWLWRAHGFFAGIAWALLSPCAIAASVLRDLFRSPLWFQIHRGLNMLVVLFTVVAFSLAVVAIQQETPSGASADHFNPNPNPHRTVGLVIFIVALIQALLGIFRPHVPEPGQAKSTIRIVWEIAHKVLGYSCLGMAIYQVQSGIKIYYNIFSEGEYFLAIFWALIAGIGGGVAVGLITLRFTTSCKNENKVVDKGQPQEGAQQYDLPIKSSRQPDMSKYSIDDREVPSQV